MAIASLFRFHHLDAENSPQPTRETQPQRTVHRLHIPQPLGMSLELQLLGSHVSTLDDLAAGIMVKNHGDWNL